MEFVESCEYLDASVTGLSGDQASRLKVPPKFTLNTNFPTKTYGESDYGSDLKTLGLVPNAMLLCQAVDEEEEEG